MFQLILVVLAIALTSAILLASVKYLPWWTKSAALVDESVRTSLIRLEQAYDIATRGANGVPPAVEATPDGGFDAIFRPIMQLLPGSPGETSWVYGLNETAGLYSGKNYFCLKTTGTGGDEALWRGINRARATFSAEQAFLNADCGAGASVPLPSSYPTPLALTFYVAYVPGINK